MKVSLITIFVLLGGLAWESRGASLPVHPEPTTGDMTDDPTMDWTTDPTTEVTTEPSTYPTTEVTTEPSTYPTTEVTTEPSTYPTTEVTTEPSTYPTTEVTTEPSTYPTTEVTTDPTTIPTTEVTTDPTTIPTTEVTTDPTTIPTTEVTTDPTTIPTTEVTTDPTAIPTTEVTTDPTTIPTTEVTTDPTTIPTTEVTTDPTTERWTTPEPIEKDYCPAYPNATEHTSLFPHTNPVVSTSCGEYFDCKSGGIFYKPFEAVIPNERCVWTIAVPNAKGYDVTVQYFGYQPTQNNENDHGLIVSEFGAWRTPTHFIPTDTDKVELTNTSMVVITFFTGSRPTSNQAGFILQFKARTEGELPRPVNALSKHFMVGHEQYYLAHDKFYANELSSYVFLPKDNIYRPDKENRAVYMYGSGQNCAYDQLKVYFFNTTCVGPHKWEYQGRLCGTTPTYELIKSPEPMLVVFETTRGTTSTATYRAPHFTYSASC